MRTIDLEPTQASTRPIHESFLRYNPYLEKHVRVQTKVQDAFSALQELHTQGRDIPIAAMNLIIENSSSGPDALHIYKSIPTLCSTNPNLHTFNFLFRALRSKKSAPPDRSALMFLVAEMKALAIAPDMITYDRILLVCAQHGFWMDATLFWREMRERGFMPRAASVMALLELAKESVCSGEGSAERREFIIEVERLREEAAVADGEREGGIATDMLHRGATRGDLTHKEPAESEARPGHTTAQNEMLPPEPAKEMQWEAEGPGRHLQWSREVRDAMRKDIQEILQQELGDDSGDKVLEKETR
jgi:pentatricopeptide repeat protein